MDEDKCVESDDKLAEEGGSEESKKSAKEKEKENHQKVNGFGGEHLMDGEEAKARPPGDDSMEVTENECDRGVENKESEPGVSVGDVVMSGSDSQNVEKEVVPHGWKRRTIDGSDPQKFYYVSPTGDEMYSLDDIKSYCETHALTIGYDAFFFTSQDNKSKHSRPSNSTSPLPPSETNTDSIALCGTDSNSQGNNDSSDVPEKRRVTTSSLLRAYRPSRSEARSSAKEQNGTASNQVSKNSTTPSSGSKNIAQQNDGSGSVFETAPSLVLECSTESLSLPQASKIKKLQDDLAKLKLLLCNGTQLDDTAKRPQSGNTVTPPTLSNGTNLVSFQMPQFLLLSNQVLGTGATTLSQANPTPTATLVTMAPTLSTSAQPKSTTTLKKASSRQLPTQNTTPPSRLATVRSTSSNSSVSTSKPRTTPLRISPDIEVVKEMRAPGNTSAKTTNKPSSTTGVKISAFPLLSIVCRPRNTTSSSIAVSQRRELDAKVKAILIKSSHEFVEWLLSEGLIRMSQFCAQSDLTPGQIPFKLKLGMFSDPKVLPSSGGYVWISETPGKKYVSVYSGSIFGSTLIDKVAPAAVLKLIYHWACQTAIANVESWVKVEKAFINKMFSNFRSVCCVMLHDKVYHFGFDGTSVELGIVSLGTSTADGSRKAVKVEILGLYDCKMKSYRLFASEPEHGGSSRQRFIRILKPLTDVVHSNAHIICDQSVDRSCLYNMHYGKVTVCETSDDENNPKSNAKIMSYLRKHVPKMFQSTLSQLTLQQVQLVLDELCWRERFGNCSSQAYYSMIEHLTYLTERETDNPGLLNLLETVAQNPNYNWRYKTQLPTRPTPVLQPKIIMSTPSAGTINPQVTMDAPAHLNKLKMAIDRPNKVSKALPAKTSMPKEPLGPIVRPIVPKLAGPPAQVSAAKEADVELEPFYYGQIEGDSTLGREVNNYTFCCHICQKTFVNNVEFYTHLKRHLSNWGPGYQHCCSYCAYHFESSEAKESHQNFRHLQKDMRFMWCRICNESYQDASKLTYHMTKRHCESELPYRCEVCNYSTSIFHQVIDHFNEEHDGSPYVQCHYCLMVKTITAFSVTPFSLRMFQHMQKHASQQGQCKFCTLSFYSKYYFDEHRKKDHTSRAKVKGLRRYLIKDGHPRITFRPPGGKQANRIKASPYFTVNDTVAISSTLEKLDHININLGNDDEDNGGSKYYCIECDRTLDLENHFVSYQKCTKCSYSSCCRSMVNRHSQVFHPAKKSRSIYYKIGPAIMLPKHLYCICGFSTRSGNHLARHLALCEGGRMSAYPSMLDALVCPSNPDTPNPAALMSLGLSRTGPRMKFEESAEPSLDMSNFMSFNMDVDDCPLQDDQTTQPPQEEEKHRTVSIGALKTDNTTPHTLVEVDGPKQLTRKRCRGCYERMTLEAGFKVARNKAKRVSTFCRQCDNQPYLCIQCFLERHNAD